jgi:ABC-type Zn uptake system ZnuABC Zn-binding protein ZnuA
MRLAAEDAEVRSLVKPQSAPREPELASRGMAMMAPAQAFVAAGITLQEQPFSRET